MSNDAINKLKKTIYENMSYTNQDFEAIIKNMLDIVQSGELPTKWNNLTETDPIMMLFALFAAHTDILNYMMDYRVMESYMSTARERASMVRIAKSYGYKIPSYSCARTQYRIDTTNLEEDKAYELKPFTPIKDSSGMSWVYIGYNKTTGAFETKTFQKGVGNQYQYIDLFQGTVESLEFSGIDTDFNHNTRVISNTNVALSNAYDTTPVARLTYNNTTEFYYTDFTRTASQDNKIFDMDVDPASLTYIQFSNDLNLIGDYSGNFVLQYINTMGDIHLSSQDITTVLSEGGEVLLEYVDGSFYNGKKPATPEEIKQGFKTFYAGINSLVTVWDYANYIKNVQKSVPSISKIFVLDNQVDSGNGSGSPTVENLTVSIYATVWDATESKHRALTQDEESELLKDLKLSKITGVLVALNDTEANTAFNNKTTPLTEATINVKIEANIDSEMGEIIKEEITNLLLDTNIGELITVKSITQHLVEKDLSKYFQFGSIIKLKKETIGGGTTQEALKQQLLFNEYVSDVTITITLPQGS